MLIKEVDKKEDVYWQVEVMNKEQIICGVYSYAHNEKDMAINKCREMLEKFNTVNLLQRSYQDPDISISIQL